MRYFLLGLLCLLIPVSGRAAEPNFPALTGRVVDTANVIPEAQEKALTKELADFEKQTKHQLVVVTIPTLGDYAISDYGYQLGRHWKIGRKGIDDGILLIQSTGERKFRIEVGRGMEYILTDAKASEIIRHTLIFTMKRKDLPEATKNATALTEGARAIMKLGAITKDQVDEWEAKEKAARAKAEAEASDTLWTVLGFLFTFLALGGLGFWFYRFITKEQRAIKKAHDEKVKTDRLKKELEESAKYVADYNERMRVQRENHAREVAIRQRQRDEMLAAMTPSQRKNFLDAEEARREASRQQAYRIAEQQRLRDEEERQRRNSRSDDTSFGGFYTSGGSSTSSSSSSSSSDNDSWSGGGGGDFGGGGADGDY